MPLPETAVMAQLAGKAALAAQAEPAAQLLAVLAAQPAQALTLVQLGIFMPVV
jgi:hypothetical protein